MDVEVCLILGEDDFENGEHGCSENCGGGGDEEGKEGENGEREEDSFAGGVTCSSFACWR